MVGLPETDHHVGALRGEGHGSNDAGRCATEVAGGVLDECVEIAEKFFACLGCVWAL